jgi:hypothetical protein
LFFVFGLSQDVWFSTSILPYAGNLFTSMTSRCCKFLL